MNYKLWSLQTYSFFLLLFAIYSCSNANRPPESIVVEAPKSSATQLQPGKFCVFILLKNDNSVWVKYDSLPNEQNFEKIASPVTENLKNALDQLEKIHRLDITKMPDDIVVKGNMSLSKSKIFKYVKEAFKQKGIYKFRIITTSDN